MSIFGVIITYACSWWMVLFMVLPWRVKLAANPPAGPAASAPINPLLRKKMLATTLLAIIPTLVLYFYVGSARASDIYHAGTNDCPPAVAHQPRADVAAKDTDATIRDGTNIMSSVGDVYVGVDVPAQNYSSDANPDLRHSDIYAGAVKVKPDGSVEYNGQPITQQPLDNGKCK